MNETCGQCQHWKRLTRDPTNLGAPEMGECREGPPLLVVVPVSPGHQALEVRYPSMPAYFAACSRHRRLVNGDQPCLS